MNVETTIAWQKVDWPVIGTTAAKYAVFRNSASTPEQTVTNIVATVTYDDTTAGEVFLIRPTDGATPTPAYGPAQAVFVGVGPLNNRAWFRTMIRRAVADRIDKNVGQVPTIADDEINDYLNDALRKFAQYFPREAQQRITLIAAQRDYTNLPADMVDIISIRYDSSDTHYKLMLREEPFKGGETTPTSWIGYPKLGIFQPAWGGRFYSGRYEIHDDGTGLKTLSLDFDPPGDGDSLLMRYHASYNFPPDDLTAFTISLDELEGLGLYVQAKCWLQIEARDVSLSRWKEGGRRDDLPTEKMSTRMFGAWQKWIDERRTLRPKNIRLVRRT